MGTNVEDRRSRLIALRLTEKEEVQLRGQMQVAGYLSLSRYIRDSVLEDRKLRSRTAPLTNREMREQINAISTEISKIGIDYSRVAEGFSTLMQENRDELRTLGQVRSATYDMRRINKFSQTLKKRMDELISLFLNIESLYKSRQRDPSSTIKTDRKMLQRIEIIGNLIKDAELRTSKEGNQFINFRVAVNESYGEERNSTFYDVTYPNGKIYNYLKKGRQVYVSGRLSLSVTTWKEAPYLNARISARELELCGGKED